MGDIMDTIFDEAKAAIYGARNVAYGHPADDFTRAGRMWGAIIGIPDVSPEVVGLCMAAIKIAREVHSHSRDNLVDLAGYAGTVQRVYERMEEEADGAL